MPRGRSKGLIEKRNEALCRRWYYWTELQRLRFDDALKILSEQEFFLSEDRIMGSIRTRALNPSRGFGSLASPRHNWACSSGNDHNFTRSVYWNVSLYTFTPPSSVYSLLRLRSSGDISGRNRTPCTALNN